MGAYTKDAYLDTWAKMEEGKWYTASELGMYAASMTAMVRRGLVEDLNCRPKKYRKKENKLIKILNCLRNFDYEFFTLYREGQSIGMLCSLDKERVLDCWEKLYDLTNVNRLVVKNVEFSI